MDEAREHLVLMPGMDGTGKLFAPLLAELPEWISSSVVSYQPRQKLSYSELSPFVLAAVPRGGSFTLLAESFSGPLAVQFASEHSGRLRALILCASFVRNPLSPYLGLAGSLLSPMLFRLPVPELAVRLMMTGMSGSPALIRLIRESSAEVSGTVMAHRLQQIIETDVSDLLRAISQPVLYLKAGRDRLVSERSVGEIRRLKPEAEVVEIDGPHLLLQCSPGESVKVITDFLQRWQGSQTLI
ncbi:MAG TPA: alpha/beta hydrolase [Blastocatellia bacterium]|nr:alpha/beta hydrolase [Blastocatellia bacterium]